MDIKYAKNETIPQRLRENNEGVCRNNEAAHENESIYDYSGLVLRLIRNTSLLRRKRRIKLARC